MKCAWCGFERSEQAGPCPRCQYVPQGQAQASGQARQPGGQGNLFEPTAKHAPASRGPAPDSTVTFGAPVFDAPPFGAPTSDARPPFNAPPFDAPPFDAQRFDAQPPFGAPPPYQAPGAGYQPPSSPPPPPGYGYSAPGYSAPGASQSVREQLVAAQRKLPAHLSSIPLELLGVCGVMALSGLLLLWPGLSLLSDGFPLLGDGSFGLAVGLLAIDLGAFVLALAAALGLLAWRLSHGDRVARGMSYILLGAIVFAVIVGGSHPTGLIIVMLLSAACLIVLAASPNVRQFFTGAAAPDAGQPVSITIARTLLTWFAVAAIFLGITFLPMGVLGGQMVFAGIIFLGVGVGVFLLSSRLARGEPTARLIVTILMAVYALLALIGGGRNTGTLLDLGIAAGIVCLLWLPQDAKDFFAETPVQPPAPVQQSPFTTPGNPPGQGYQPYGGSGYGDNSNSGYDGASYDNGVGYGGAGYNGAGYDGASYHNGAGYRQPGSGQDGVL